jgi:hypothetical protein
MKRLVFLLLLISGAAAHADDESYVVTPPASCFDHPEKWSYDRAKEPLQAVGDRFMTDLHECAPTLASAIDEHTSYALQDKQARIFARHSQYVMLAYGIAWGILALAALAMLMRQQKLSRQILDLKMQLKKDAP